MLSRSFERQAKNNSVGGLAAEEQGDARMDCRGVVVAEKERAVGGGNKEKSSSSRALGILLMLPRLGGGLPTANPVGRTLTEKLADIVRRNSIGSLGKGEPMELLRPVEEIESLRGGGEAGGETMTEGGAILMGVSGTGEVCVEE
jgi:hypothetical protein